MIYKYIIYNTYNYIIIIILKDFIILHVIIMFDIIYDKRNYMNKAIKTTIISNDEMPDIYNRSICSQNENQELKDFFLKNVTFNDKQFDLDNEQITAVKSNKNTLVTARAGSGKTRVLIAKLIYLLEKEGLQNDEIMTFCFNVKAKDEINDRIQNKCAFQGEYKYKNCCFASTFHSAAVKSIGDRVLEKQEEKKKLIKELIQEVENEDRDFRKKVFSFFKMEKTRINNKNYDTNNIKNYYYDIRNSSYDTLKGERVKSIGEKIIADYLFEHGIKYLYEKSFYPSKIEFNYYMNKNLKDYYSKENITKPDFCLEDENLIWEHWAIDGTETKKEQKYFSYIVGDYNEYKEKQKWKKDFWKRDWRQQLSNSKYNKPIKAIRGMIETFNNDLKDKSREDFEYQIEKLLARYGIVKEKLPEEELIQEVWNNRIDSFVTLVEQFINKIQQNYFENIEEIKNKAKNTKDIRCNIFYDLGFRVYDKYMERIKMKKPYSIDFNQLIYEHAKDINQGYEDERINKLKWILIDEYQDFSKLFDYYIDSILSRNPQIKLFCVGDDWQAINRFAGSNVKYFKNFTSKYKAASYNVSTNYRSAQIIVGNANEFIEEYPSIFGDNIIKPHYNKEIRGVYQQYSISNDYWCESQYKEILCICQTIIKQNITYINRNNKKTTILVLHRTNNLYNKNLKDIKDDIKTYLYYHNLGDKVEFECASIHSSKGKEADVVIILDVNKGLHPLYSPHSEIFNIFDETEKEVLEDEARLYYVALTRAIERLYVVYKEDLKSEYITKLSTTKKLDLVENVNK